MKSPLSNTDMILIEEEVTLKYKGKDITINHKVYKDTTTGDTFVDSELEDYNLDLIYKKYNEQYGSE